jgi:L-amino acid N-acyltransferase YncA
MTDTTISQLRLEKYGPARQAELEAFYNAFEPKGAALGLPPRCPDAVHNWIESLRAFPGFLMLDGEAIVGHAVLCPEVYTGEVAVFVASKARGQGIGKRLLSALIAEAVELDLRRIWGVSEPDNIPMLRLARSCGFQSGKELGEFSLDLRTIHHSPLQTAPSK